ncbi:HepT-like ribonuclease domain-containing protein [Anoxybacillus flavithermus]|uniref:HepT-like ribonuclease domain-containing protein n=1 Tax=Anoxybacillus flavithermus TaxID=33934 RepID=UPI001F50F05C|nr:DUF86 domain-containing protein [Anoxybacillus flavithermus]
MQDILVAAEKIEKYTQELSYDDFLDNDLISDAVIKNILVIREVTKNIPDEIRQASPHIEWRKMDGMRDMMIHGYFSINYRIVWDVVRNKIPVLKQHVERLLNESWISIQTICAVWE